MRVDDVAGNIYRALPGPAVCSGSARRVAPRVCGEPRAIPTGTAKDPSGENPGPSNRSPPSFPTAASASESAALMLVSTSTKSSSSGAK